MVSMRYKNSSEVMALHSSSPVNVDNLPYISATKEYELTEDALPPLKDEVLSFAKYLETYFDGGDAQIKQGEVSYL